ncbi:hypothetical protein QTO30_20840 [Yoonia sp. GPGPB17]|uniref:hypothetical protein n=1 Tax=Yoonia sp. GPGPB17 TaxID=3026147 RepID=UPI0030BC1CC7
MSKLTNDDFVFVEVTKTYMLTSDQAKRLVSIARLVCADTQSFSIEDDGSELRTLGEDFLTDDGQPDYADAAGQLADPEGLLSAELVSTSTLNLDDTQIEEFTSYWPEDWREEAYNRQHNIRDAGDKKAGWHK